MAGRIQHQSASVRSPAHGGPFLVNAARAVITGTNPDRVVGDVRIRQGTPEPAGRRRTTLSRSIAPPKKTVAPTSTSTHAPMADCSKPTGSRSSTAIYTVADQWEPPSPISPSRPSAILRRYGFDWANQATRFRSSAPDWTTTTARNCFLADHLSYPRLSRLASTI